MKKLQFIENSFFYLVLIVFLNAPSYAAEVYGTINANSPIVWKSATPNNYFDSSAISPSAWTITQERTTAEWYPGSLDNQAINTVTFVDHSTGQSFETNLKLLGVEYNLGSSSTYYSSKDYGANVGMGVATECMAVSTITSMAKVKQETGLCASRTGYVAASRVEPFKFYRPVFSLPDVSEDIYAATVGSGTYTASINLAPTYFFTSETGTMTYTRMAEVLLITIDYQAAILKSLTVLGSGIIDPVYDKGTKRISGVTRYDVMLGGTLPSGVVMTFSPTGEVYELTNTRDSRDKIPYTIICSVGCSGAEQVIVEDGELNRSSFPDSQVVTVNGVGNNQVNVAYDISFDIDGRTINSGDYQGSFNVVYEVNL